MDGVYGPQTVEAVERFQRDAGLPVTGLVDPATQLALVEALAGVESAQVGALQGIRIGTGYQSGPWFFSIGLIVPSSVPFCRISASSCSRG
ncbi:MAG: peptidoglycan-binding domain-containing protein [Acidimicrobiia bacterium]